MIWFKFYGQEFLTDPKMMKLNTAQKLMWIGLLCMASGRDSNVVKFLTEDNLKILIGLDPNYEEWKLADGSFKKFEELEMLKSLDKDTIVLTNFDKRQESNLTGYERVKRHREKQYIISDNNDSVIKDNIDKIDKKDKKEYIYNSISFLKNIPDVDLDELSEKFSVPKKFIHDRAEDVLNYCEAHGKKYKDYKAALRNFCKSHIEKHGNKAESKGNLIR